MTVEKWYLPSKLIIPTLFHIVSFFSVTISVLFIGVVVTSTIAIIVTALYDSVDLLTLQPFDKVITNYISKLNNSH